MARPSSNENTSCSTRVYIVVPFQQVNIRGPPEYTRGKPVVSRYVKKTLHYKHYCFSFGAVRRQSRYVSGGCLFAIPRNESGTISDNMDNIHGQRGIMHVRYIRTIGREWARRRRRYADIPGSFKSRMGRRCRNCF